MDYIEIFPANWPWLLLIVGSLVLCGALLYVSVEMLPLAHFRGPLVAILGLAIGLSGSVYGYIQAFHAPMIEHQRAIAEGIAENYGVTLTLSQVDALSYPYAMPTSDFQVFGKAVMDEPTEDGFSRTETFLIWKNGEMMLAQSADGESFSELPKD